VRDIDTGAKYLVNMGDITMIGQPSLLDIKSSCVTMILSSADVISRVLL